MRGLLLIRWTACAAWVGNDQPTDPKLAEYLQCAFDCGKSPASSSMIAAAVQWLFTSTDQPSPVGKRSKAKIKQLADYQPQTSTHKPADYFPCGNKPAYPTSLPLIRAG
ncbi:MAG: hypothetical protein OXE81_07740 [Gammaproteobacteria bacterium]|nr:hypothetical protein [Gammaproteobacteria bacterium]